MQTIKVTEDVGYLAIQLDRGAVNAINRQMVRELSEVISAAHEAGQGILLSGKAGIFSAGVDVVELLGSEPEQVRDFWYAYFEMVRLLFNHPYPVVVAIGGHCPAGGCVLAIAADYRVMISEEYFYIGLNEAAVGIVVPSLVAEMYRLWVPRDYYLHIQEGKLLTPSQALACGLVQGLASAEKLSDQAQAAMQLRLAQLPKGFAGTKRNLRASVGELFNNVDVSLQATLDLWQTTEFSTHFEKFVKRVTKG